MDETPNPGAPSQVPPQVIDGFQFSGLATHWRARRIVNESHQVHPLYWGANPNGTHASMWPLEDFSLGEIHRRWGGGVYQIAPMRRMTNGRYVFSGGWTPAIQLQGEPKPSPFSIPMASLDAARDAMPGQPDPLDEEEEPETEDDETDEADEEVENEDVRIREYERRGARRSPDLTMAFSGDFPAELKTAMGLYSFITQQTIAQFAIHEERQRLAHEEQLQRLQQYHGQTLQLLQSARSPRTDPALVDVLSKLSETLDRDEPEPSYPAQFFPSGAPIPGPPGMPGMPIPPSGPPTVATQITDLINGLGNLLDRVPQEVKDEAFRRMFARFAPAGAK